MYEIKIYAVDDSQVLNKFFVCILTIIEKEYPNILGELWRIHSGVSAGYGETVCHIEDNMLTNDYVEIKGDNLFTALVVKEECFYNVCITIENKKLKLGIFDTTYAYIYLDDYKIVEKVVECSDEMMNFKIKIVKGVE